MIYVLNNNNYVIQIIFIFSIILTLWITNVSAYTFVPQTGQIQSLVDSDDGDIKSGKQWPLQRFVDHKDGTITDQLTGLMWIKDADCSSEISSGAAAIYWSRALEFTSTLNTNALNAPCTGYDKNYSDWRIPNINETTSLMRAGLGNQTIANWLNIPENNSPGFSQTNIVAKDVWTSTTSASNPEMAWVANLESGGTKLVNKSNTTLPIYIFSAVRTSELSKTATPLPTGQTTSFEPGDDGYWHNIFSQQNIPAYFTSNPRFIKTETGTVIDKLTRLTWILDANCANINGSNWFDAVFSTNYIGETAPFLNNCSSYTETDTEKTQTWRLPNINELKSLVDYGQSNPALDTEHPFNIQFDKIFWSSTSANGLVQNTAAWSVDFSTGEINATLDKNSFGYTWPVSGPVNFPDIISDTSSLSFGNVFSGSQSSSKTIAIANNGTSDLHIQSIRSADAHFTIQSNKCSSNILKPEDSCEISVAFLPSSEQNYNSNLIIISDALGLEEYLVNLTGGGISIKKEESNPNCFIATAAYGSYLSKEVTLLRSFRDSYLLQSKSGTKLVELYYDLSPPIATAISQSQSLRFLTRLLLTPVVYAIKYPVITIIVFCILLIFLLTYIYHRAGHNETICRILRAKQTRHI